MWEVSPEEDVHWLYIGMKEGIFGLHKSPAEEMLKLAARGEITDETMIRPETDSQLHSYAAWKKICVGMSPFLVECESYNQMRKLTIPTEMGVRFKEPHPLVPQNLVEIHKPVPLNYNRTPRKQFFTPDETIPPFVSPNSTADSLFNSSFDDCSSFYSPPRRTYSALAANFLATLDEPHLSRKSKYYGKTIHHLRGRTFFDAGPRHLDKAVNTDTISLTTMQASKLLSQILGMDVEVT